ncbi:MAG: hypothetical protein KC933_28580 [Myxococcales bacterium]|nr:hypothetical protein [Myxococcales bacterium]
MARHRWLALLGVAALVGCSGPPTQDAGTEDAGTQDAGTQDAGTEDAGTEDAGTEDAGDALRFEHAWPDAELCSVAPDSRLDCCTSGRIELPAFAASILDLRGLSPGAPGTCGDPVKQPLPSDPARYPLMVLLPELTGPDPSCASSCAGRGETTTFGIVLELPATLTAELRPLVVAPPPWFYVYDHNSLAGDTCLGGYQEFGQRACVRPSYGGYIGFATGAVATPPRAALIDLQPGPNGGVETCCPYLANLP